MQSLMQKKRRLASKALWPIRDEAGDAAALQAMLKEGSSNSAGDVVKVTMSAMFRRDGVPEPEPDLRGAWPFS